MENNKIKKGIVFIIILIFILGSLPINSAKEKTNSEEKNLLSDINFYDYVNNLNEEEKKVTEQILDFGVGIYITFTHTGVLGHNNPIFIPLILRTLKPTGFVLSGRIECYDIMSATTVFNILDGFNPVDRQTGSHLFWFMGPGITIFNQQGDIGTIITLSFAYHLRSL